jgi:hypothetical protein
MREPWIFHWREGVNENVTRVRRDDIFVFNYMLFTFAIGSLWAIPSTTYLKITLFHFIYYWSHSVVALLICIFLLWSRCEKL